MGVPSLYKWITQRYPEVKLKPNREEDHLTDNLYLDFNAIIHPCCNKALENMADTDTELYKNLEKYMDEVIARIRPRRLLYISVDGVAPRAKLNQQRSRRFVHAREVSEQGNFYFKDDCGNEPAHHSRLTVLDQEIENSAVSKNMSDEATPNGCGVFDTNAISPGTEFMQRLDAFLQELISFKMSFDQRWTGFNVIYSSYRVPGEGEQKIMEYIRKHQNPKFSSVIFSPDADLIFLGLSLFDHSVMVLREEPPKHGNSNGSLSNEKDFVLVDIPRLKHLIIRDFKYVMKMPFNHRKFLEDWIFLCFTVGNDFLPCTPCFEIRTDALDKLTHILQTVYLNTRSFITDNGKINYDVLREFFIECARRENTFIVEKRNNLVNVRQRMNLPYDPSEEFFLETERGKIRFYVEKMGITSEKDLLIACEEYIKGLEWVYNYYFYDMPSWEWYYPYHFAPFMTDLALVKDVKFKFTTGRPLKPLEQLLTVLPPSSKDLLPSCLHSVFDEFKEYYPTEFKLDMFQKCMDWQAVPILPFINVQDLIKAFENRQNELKFSECERNITGYPIFYSKQPRLIAKIYPLYTELKPYDYIKFDEFNGRVYALNKFRALEEEVNLYGFNYINRIVKFTFDQRKIGK
ncbi:uncharacterized protein VICG_01089 [Vittaforma corneae ATCC 50505]|uniref:Uncharacterized protein n=1 Tax=Vittaforma corneae (strain ATCC 50505) TaxID=993615 RepID=L2GN25_VITCO|nr:uncharacterized protein VICG_01089 [Vittaforma corneae ATCC 50505]ELA41905.1 hypothetical protein VICG_01089 [Vittaforma corneae ATCC 50505]